MDKTPKMSAAEFRNRGGTPKQAVSFANMPPRPPEHPAHITNQFFIGIDPGKNTGFALWQRKHFGVAGQFIEVNTLTFWGTIRRLEKLVREFGAEALRVRIEDVRANKPTFSDKEGNAAIRENISQKVGSNKRDCQLIIDFLEEQRIAYDPVPPRSRATGKGKVQASFFAGVKGFPTRSTEHSRDAAALVLGL